MRPLAQRDALYPDSVKWSFFHEGEFLGITEAVQALEECQLESTPKMVDKYHYCWKYSPDMLELYEGLPPKQFPVVRLRHVTILDNFMGILQDWKISGSDRLFVLKGVERPLRVSCWGVHIPPMELEAYREKRFAEFMQRSEERRVSCNLSPEASAEVRAMLANSPAMSEESRYGNFQFSFNTKDLLAMYRAQHCRGQKPVLRVLGTEAYKQELVHWILIHSPDCSCFDHLPTVDPPGPFSRDGNLTWCPESMTNLFVYEIFNSVLCKKPKSSNSVLCPPNLYSVLPNNVPMYTYYYPWIWSNAVFAFYLPQDRALRIDRRSLLENVQACETALAGLRHPPQCYISKESAQGIIDAM